MANDNNNIYDSHFLGLQINNRKLCSIWLEGMEWAENNETFWKKLEKEDKDVRGKSEEKWESANYLSKSSWRKEEWDFVPV